MGCHDSGKQTEFEFFQDLKEHPEVIMCAGPVTQIGFTGPTLTEFNRALHRLGVSEDYLDLYEHEVLDSGHMSIYMCAKHWFHHAQGVGTIAAEVNNSDWEQIGYHLFRVTCMTNGWDYKEVLNFIQTASSLRRSKED